MKQRLYMIGQATLLAASLVAAALSFRTADWRPLPLVVLLLGLTVMGQLTSVTVRGRHLTAAFVALVLAMSLLGPTPAVVFGVIAMSTEGFRRRLRPAVWISNLATFAAFTMAGGLLIRGLIGDVHAPSNHQVQGVWFSLAVFGVFMITNALNFLLVAADDVLEGRSLIRQVRYSFVPLLPGQVSTGALTAILAVTYTNLGYPVLLGSVLVILIFQYLAVALLRSQDRAEQLAERSTQLATLQLGVLTTLMETLNLRDATTARHAAAVARYARDLARETGCSETEQDLVHTAGLLHDIGRFAFPDRILKADSLSNEDWALVRRHPQDGATVVGRLDGYGPVSDLILYHHERVDGTGYPAGLIGREIPLLSRVLAICETYDVLTARDSYRQPITPRDAFAELRSVAGRQLDADLTESFIIMLERDGHAASVAGDHADFSTELNFEKRARELAQPSLT
jgi:putative nucleotidyltransferase with HDIG domain